MIFHSEESGWNWINSPLESRLRWIKVKWIVLFHFFFLVIIVVCLIIGVRLVVVAGKQRHLKPSFGCSEGSSQMTEESRNSKAAWRSKGLLSCLELCPEPLWLCDCIWTCPFEHCRSSTRKLFGMSSAGRDGWREEGDAGRGQKKEKKRCERTNAPMIKAIVFGSKKISQKDVKSCFPAKISIATVS